MIARTILRGVFPWNIVSLSLPGLFPDLCSLAEIEATMNIQVWDECNSNPRCAMTGGGDVLP